MPSGGVAIFDYDGDGWPDIYLLNGSTMPALLGKEKAPQAALYRNLGNWKFEDVTDKAGLANERWGMGVAIGDYDNDGRPDIFVGNFGVSRLYHNNGDGTFTDVADRLGVARKGWSTGASWGDYDGDGRLDLFVPGYLEIDLNNLPRNPSDANKPGAAGQNFCQFRGSPVMCGPRSLTGESDTLYHQKPDGTFEDVSVKAGVDDPQKYYGFTSAFVHVNEDALLDLIVVNDSTPKLLYMNKGDGTFEEVGYPSGVALNENGREQAGMGLAVGDYDNDGRVDFHITNFSDDSNVLYHNDGDGNFSDITFLAGLGEITLPFLGWGTSFIDYDNDGWKDLLIAQGHDLDTVELTSPNLRYREPLLLAHNNGKRFADVSAQSGAVFQKTWVARGVAIGDLDNDGRLDAVITTNEGPAYVLHNETATHHHWIWLKLVGHKSNRDGIGAGVRVTTATGAQFAIATTASSYLSSGDKRVHFGLGNSEKIAEIQIRWPSGIVQTLTNVRADQILQIDEPAVR